MAHFYTSFSKPHLTDWNVFQCMTTVPNCLLKNYLSTLLCDMSYWKDIDDWFVFFYLLTEAHKFIHLSIIPASSGACRLLRVNGERPRRLLKPTLMTLCLLGLCCSQGRLDELQQLGERILPVGGKDLMMHHHFDCNSLRFPLKRDI